VCSFRNCELRGLETSTTALTAVIAAVVEGSMGTFALSLVSSFLVHYGTSGPITHCVCVCVCVCVWYGTARRGRMGYRTVEAVAQADPEKMARY
jgi:hypothetical protein